MDVLACVCSVRSLEPALVLDSRSPHCIELSSACKYDVADSSDQDDQASQIMEDKMLKSNQDHAANLHIYAAHAHTAAAAAHRRGDDEAAGELSSRAQEYSSKAAEKTEEIARRIPERLRA